MKRVLMMSIAIGAFLMGSMFVGVAKTTKKSSRQAPKETAAKIEFQLNDNYNPIITGHVYTCTIQGCRMEFSFEENGKVVVTSTVKGKGKIIETLNYVADGPGVDIYEEGSYIPVASGIIHDDGRTITTNTNVVMKAIK